MDTFSLMWDETGRDYEHERRELSRTAALTDAERLVGEFVYRAANDVDLVHRLALAEPQLQAIATERLYPMGELTKDLTERWQLLSTAQAATARKTAAVRQVSAAQERAMDATVARLAAVAARENPGVPMAECLTLAAEAVAKHADAYPLAYESWGGTGDGPFTDRAKHWKPPGLKADESGRAADPGANGGDSTFDEVHRRLDDMEARTGGPTTASLEPTVAGFYQRLKDWWRHGPEAPASTFSPQSHPQPPAPSHELLHGFDDAKAEMDKKWDANAASPGASAEYTVQHASDDLLHGFDKARDEMAEKWDANLAGPGASEHYRPPVPGGFSHAETGHATAPAPGGAPAGGFSHPETPASGGQAPLPTDPSAHTFSDSATHSPRQRQDWNIPTHFSAALFE